MNLTQEHVVVALLSVAAWLPRVAGAEERVEAERRDFTTSTGIVPLGQVQVEVGAAWERSDGVRRWTLGENLVRVPLAQQLEVRFELPSYRIEHESERVSGFDDAAVEMRWRFLRSRGVDLALQGSAMLPIGSRHVAERNLHPGLLLAATLKLSESTELVLNAGGRRASENGKRFGQTVAAASLRTDLGEKWNVLAEVYGFDREERGGPAHGYAALGASYAIDTRTALYVNAGRGFGSDNGPARVAHVGIARRF